MGGIEIGTEASSLAAGSNVDVIDNYELFSILGFVSFHAPLLLYAALAVITQYE